MPLTALGVEKYDAKIVFEDGAIYGMASCYEQNIRNDYDLLEKIDGFKGEGMDLIRKNLVRRIKVFC